MITDPLLPAASVLLGGEAQEMLAAAAGFAHGTLISMRPVQVQYYPGHSLAVLYDGVVDWAGLGATGEAMVAMTAAKNLPAGALVLEADGLQVGVWRLPHDPALPGLAVARTDGSDGQRALLGADVTGPIEAVTLSYRPGRRAVVRLTADAHRVYVKVVRPRKTAEIREVHERFAHHLPSPRVLRADHELGLVVLEELPGEGLVAALGRGVPLPTSADLLGLLSQLGAVPCDGQPPLRTARGEAQALAGLIRAVLPFEADRVDALLARIGDDPPDDPPLQTIHGDLYDAQLLVDDDGRITGVLDLDRSGPGHVVDDLARMLAHLDALAVFRPELADRATAYRDALWPDLAAATDERELARRTAAVLVALATGPFSALQDKWAQAVRRYLDGAAFWLDRAD
ncbi:MAG TPA: aminoglycoside phosphotransferase family protein [Mycobacteriales bacterium]|nr:aminoglycoside phosphotransferase family protein [Mycobacteriales bacterium]